MRGLAVHIFKLAGVFVFSATPQFLGKMKNITAYEGTEKVTFTCVIQDTGDQQWRMVYYYRGSSNSVEICTKNFACYLKLHFLNLY